MDRFNIFDYIADEYELLSKIKYNGSSNLFLLYHKICGRKVLLKSGRADLIENEAYILSKVSGEGIPEIYQCFEQKGTAYLFRQYIEGRTLRQCLENDGTFSAIKTAEIGIAVCKIISRLHKYNPPIIHRDIKLDNIVLTHDGKIYIIDLGISREFNPAASRDTVVMGTSSIAPPEQFGYKQTDMRSDIYSIGVLLHEMITGETALSKVKCSRELSYIIKKCTMFSPDDRYHNVDDIAKALRKFLDRRKNFIKAIAIGSAFFVFFASLGVWFSKMNISSKPKIVCFMAINNSYPGDYQLSKNIPKKVLEKFDGDIKVTLKIKVGSIYPWANFVPVGYLGENAKIINLVDEVTCSYERTSAGFMEMGSNQTECEFILSHDIVFDLHEQGICFQATNVTVQYAILSDAGLNNEDFFDDSFIDSLEPNPLEAKYYFSFNGTSEDTIPVVKGSINTADEDGGRSLVEDSSIRVKYAEGKFGKALYLDGTYGLKLPIGELGASYTIVFWVKALKNMTGFMPVLQAGTNLSVGLSEKWLNITKTDWEWDSSRSPVIITKEGIVDDTAYWPWYAGQEEDSRDIITPESGWQHIIVTVDGTQKLNLWDKNMYSSKSSTYINGEFYSTGVAVDDIFDANVEAYLGINPWNDLFIGYIDELRFFDICVTEEQAKEIFTYDEKQ